MRYGIQQDWYEDFNHKDTVGYATDIITDEAVNYISEDRENPFFLYLSYNAPHFGKGWDVGRQQVINFMQAKDDDLKAVQYIKDPIRRQFAAMVKSMDDGIGRVLQTLKNKGLDENTLVVFMPDNGGDYKYVGSNMPYRGQKATLYEGGIRVPCVMKYTGVIPAGLENDYQVGAINLFPTFCELAGISRAKYKPDGNDILPILKGGEMKQREMLFALHNASALRVGNWKLIKNKGEKVQLFNLKSDPYEKENIAEKRPEILSRMETRHDELLKDISVK